ncbi:MAG: nitrogen fixation protein NifX [Nitrospirae bacterium]|nr:nitrogen fixation protein NifX [Nitrospirota bacterium]
MKVAFATTDGISVNEHFGRAGMFVIYELNSSGHSLVEIRRFSEGIDTAVEETKGMGKIHDERVENKVDRISDCRIIYLTEIGGPSAARLARKGIMPVKVKEPVSIEESVQKLSETLKNSPPPWLRKAMNSD